MLRKRAEVLLANTKNAIPAEQRPLLGQSLPLGDTGDGNTGVPSGEQGISNRPGDQPDAVSAGADDEPDEAEDDEEDLEDESDDDVDEDDEDADDEDEDEEGDGDDLDEQTDPSAEPGKPV